MFYVSVLSGIASLFFISIALRYRSHGSTAIFLFACLLVVSDIVNPIIFMANRDMYSTFGWSAVRSYDFSLDALIMYYSNSYFICIVIFLVTFTVRIALRKNWRHSFAANESDFKLRIANKSRSNSKDRDAGLVFFVFLMILIYYPLYNSKVGVTGLPGELPYRLSGAFHYFRAYIVPILLVLLLNRSKASGKVFVAVLIYSIIAGVAAASRFVGLLPLVLLAFHYFRAGRLFYVFSSCFSMLFVWFVVTTSRDLTFDGGTHNLLAVLQYSLTNISFVEIVSSLDLMSGRLSGAQQIVLVGQLRGNEECSNILRYVLGFGEVCSNTAGVVYGLDLSGTSYGIGLSLIPSIIISGSSLLDYYLPAVWVASLLLLAQFFYDRLVVVAGWHGFSGLYLFLSVLFLFLGQIMFLYYLNVFVACIFIVRFILLRKRWILGSNYAN